jgi:hypothetical protein
MEILILNNSGYRQPELGLYVIVIACLCHSCNKSSYVTHYVLRFQDIYTRSRYLCPIIYLSLKGTYSSLSVSGTLQFKTAYSLPKNLK